MRARLSPFQMKRLTKRITALTPVPRLMACITSENENMIVHSRALEEDAKCIGLMAASIFATLVARHDKWPDQDRMIALHDMAITEAFAIWRQTRERMGAE